MITDGRLVVEATEPLLRLAQLALDLLLRADVVDERVEPDRGLVLEAVGAEAGLIKLKGEVWSARSFDPHHTIEAGRHVDVVQIDGATAVVYESEI